MVVDSSSVLEQHELLAALAVAAGSCPTVASSLEQHELLGALAVAAGSCLSVASSLVDGRAAENHRCQQALVRGLSFTPPLLG